MPRFGVQAVTFAGRWDLPDARRAIDAAAHLGFGAMELPVARCKRADFVSISRAAQVAGIELVARAELPSGCSVLGQAERARALLGRALQDAEALGASALGGALLHAPGNANAQVKPGDGALIVEVLADLAREAASRGVAIFLEPAHKFESPFVNTVTQASAIVRAVGSESMALGLSTLQLHIGEANLRTALRQAGSLLRCVRIVENTGGMPGTGAVRWESLWRGLREIEYDGLLLLEAPRPANAGERSIGAAGAQMSRIPPETDLYPEEYAASGLAFLKTGVAWSAAVESGAEPQPPVGAEAYPADVEEEPEQPSGPHETSQNRSRMGDARASAASPGTKSYRRYV